MMVCSSPSVLKPNVFSPVWSHNNSFNDADVTEYNNYRNRVRDPCFNNITVIKKEQLYQKIETIRRRLSKRKGKAPNNSFSNDETPIKKKKFTKEDKENEVFSRMLLLPIDEDHEFIEKREKRKEIECADLPAFIPESERNFEKDFGQSKEIKVWSSIENNLNEDEVTNYFKKIKEEFGVDEEQALALLWYHKYDVNKAISDLQNIQLIEPTKWTEIDHTIFQLAFENCRLKNRRMTIHPIHKCLPHKSVPNIVQYYYSLKVTRKTALCQNLIRKNVLTLPPHIRDYINQRQAEAENSYSFLETRKADKKRNWLHNRK